MKTIIFTLLLFVCVFAQAQNLEIIQPTQGQYVIKQETYNEDSLLLIDYITPVVDSVGMINELFQEQEVREQRKARLLAQIDEAKVAINEIATLSASHTDSLFREYTQDRFASRFTATGDLPNFLIRVGSDFYRASCYVAGNGILRIELTDVRGNFLNPRQATAIIIKSRRSFRLNGLDVWGGEAKHFYLSEDKNNRRRWVEEADSAPVRITQFLNR